MSKRESLARYHLIIKKLRNHPSTFEEIEDYLALESELQEYNFTVSKRTFHRDRRDIRSIYRMDIQYDRSRGLYYIDFNDPSEINARMMEAFDTFNALNISDRLSQFIHFEKRRPQGTENLYGLLHAIRNRVQINFAYQKFWQDRITQRTAEPYALKEYRNRWYIIAMDMKDHKVKTFALDRLSALDIAKTKFTEPINFDVNAHFKHSFGVISPSGQDPQEVVLSFTRFQGQYIKTLPLHESQEILKDTADELRVKLTIHVTHDFTMEILSFGANVKVLQPAGLVEAVKEAYKEGLGRY